jgi:hypothetical protein
MRRPGAFRADLGPLVLSTLSLFAALIARVSHGERLAAASSSGSVCGAVGVEIVCAPSTSRGSARGGA